MSQRRVDCIQSCFGEQSLTALQAQLCEQLPLGCFGTKVNDHAVWQLLCYASLRRTTIEQTARTLADVPSANRVREQLREVLPVSLPEIRQLEGRLNQMLQSQLPTGLRERLKRKAVEVAGDLTDLPYHGGPEANAAEIRRSQAKSGTTHFHSYATLQIVHHRQRLTIALTFVEQGETMAAVVARLLKVARGLGVRIKRAYFDKRFASVAVFRCLRVRRVPYIIAVPARGGAGGLKQHFHGARNQRLHYTFGRSTKSPYTTEVVIVRRVFSKNEIRYFAYAVYRMSGVPLGQVYQYYRRRFGIESGYRQELFRDLLIIYSQRYAIRRTGYCWRSVAGAHMRCAPEFMRKGALTLFSCSPSPLNASWPKCGRTSRCRCRSARGRARRRRRSSRRGVRNGD